MSFHDINTYMQALCAYSYTYSENTGGERLADNTFKMKFLPVVVDDDLVSVFSLHLFLVISLCSLYGEGKGE